MQFGLLFMFLALTLPGYSQEKAAPTLKSVLLEQIALHAQ